MASKRTFLIGLILSGVLFFVGCASSGRPFSMRGIWRLNRSELEEVNRALSTKRTGSFRLASGVKDATCDTQRCELRWTASKIPVYRRGSRVGKVGKLNVKFFVTLGLNRELLAMMNDMRADGGELVYDRNDAHIVLDGDALEVDPKLNSKRTAKEEMASGFIQAAVQEFVDRTMN